MNNHDIISTLEAAPIVPLYYHEDSDIACKLMDACYKGGARAIEFTNRGAKALEVFQNMSAYAKTHYPDLALGIGSISTVEQAKEFMNVGEIFWFRLSFKKNLQTSLLPTISFGLAVVVP